MISPVETEAISFPSFRSNSLMRKSVPATARYLLSALVARAVEALPKPVWTSSSGAWHRPYSEIEQKTETDRNFKNEFFNVSIFIGSQASEDKYTNILN